MRIIIALSLAADMLSLPTRSAAPHRVTTLAAPGVIIFSGGSLRSRIVLSNWQENQRLMAALTEPVLATRTSLNPRPHIDIAMYWGAEWSRFATTPESLVVLARLHEPQLGAYYPAIRGQPAIWMFSPIAGTAGGARVVSDEAASILRKHGLPAAAK